MASNNRHHSLSYAWLLSWFNCQTDISETWSLGNSLLPSTWLKVYSNIYQSRLHVLRFPTSAQYVDFVCPKFGDENARVSFSKISLFPWCDFFFAVVSIRSFQNIYVGISLHVFWYKCRRFSTDLSQDFISMWDFKSTLEFCLRCMKACGKVNSDYGLTMSAINYFLTKRAKCVNYYFSRKCKFISLHTHAVCHRWNFSSSKSGLFFSSGYEPKLAIRNKKVGCLERF